MDRDMLQLLISQRDASFGPASLSISEEDFAHFLAVLIKEGFSWRSMPGGGYSITAWPDSIFPELLDMDLGTDTSLGSPSMCLLEASSTNALAKEWARAGAPHGSVVIADAQTQGRGRKGRAWVSNAGKGLWMSLVLRPGFPVNVVQPITLLTAVSVSRAVEELTGVIPQIKWPNDLWLCQKKVCGILCELSASGGQVNWVVLGIGINTSLKKSELPEELQGTATSLFIETGKTVRRTLLASRICKWIDIYLHTWQSKGFAPIAAIYRERMAMLGNEVHMVDGDHTRRGTIMGVDDQGALLLQTDTGVQHIVSGEVTVRLTSAVNTPGGQI